MTLPALWIRQNMLQSPGPDFNSNERPLTEAEMKVQRSLKKLSIPDWYLNNSSHPPKILMNDTPIDMRPPSWKEQNVKRTVLSSTFVTPVRNSTVNRDGILETEIGAPTSRNQYYGTFKISRSSTTQRSPVSKKRASPHSGQAREKKSSKSRLTNVSRTFPRISPSRKIQNINLVFAQPSRSSPPHALTDLDASDPEVEHDMSEDSLEGNVVEPILRVPPSLSQSLMITDLDQSEPEIGTMKDSLVIPSRETIDRRLRSPPISSDRYTITDLDVSQSRTSDTEDSSYSDRSAEFSDRTPDTSNLVDESFGSKSSEAKVPKMPDRQLTYIKPWRPTTRPEVRPCVTPEEKFTNAASFKLRASSTPQGSPVSLFAASAIEVTPRKNSRQRPISGVSVSPSTESRESPPAGPRTIQPKISNDEDICDACRADPSRARSSPSPKTRPSSGFRPRNLLPPIGEKPSSSPQPASSSTSVALLASTNKSSELESIIKRRQSKRQGKSLVQEIIEELNEKCRNSAAPTYVSPGSKNFVKKLVRALEKGNISSRQDKEEKASYRRFGDHGEHEEDDRAEEDCFVESENNSEDDVKSAAASTSISYKDTDSNGSDSDLHSPTMKLDYNYDCNMNVDKSRIEPTTTTTTTTTSTSTSTSTSMVTSTPETDEKDNDSVYWIPIAKTKLPRTSSLLSMMSRLSTTNPGQQSPCVSPIRQTTDARPNAWGMTYRTNEQHRTLRRIDEATILDSGYSDRSRVHSSESSDDTWFDDTESTWTASETGSFSNISFSLGSRLSHERQQCAGQIHGRAFVI